ncbi:unnamed protein product [Hapterophycus canaliculatus]
MDFISNTSKRSGLVLQKIGQHLLTQLEATANAPSGTYNPSTPQNHHQEQEEQQPVDPPFPLDRIPEDVQPNMLSFLPARELARIRRVSRDLLQTADRHADALWNSLGRCDFPSMASLTAGTGVEGAGYLSPHQQYVKNVMHRANDEVGNLRANLRLRESLDSYTWPIAWPRNNSHAAIQVYSAISSTFGGGSGGGDGNDGVIGLLSDLVTIPNVRIARALSHKRRAALSTVVVHSDKVIFDFRRRGLHTGPVNFLPLSTLRLENPTPLAPLLLPLLLPPAPRNTAAGGNNGGHALEDRRGGVEVEGAGLLPLAPETPTPAGFLGYAVRLLHLRPEHEPLRWTVLFALFKDLVVFETTEQAEAVRIRTPDQRLFYCALDHPGAQDDPCVDGARLLPHISHWGFHHGPAGGDGGGGIKRGEGVGCVDREGETVGDAIDRQERIACFARSSLAFLRYGGGRVERSVLA